MRTFDITLPAEQGLASGKGVEFEDGMVIIRVATERMEHPVMHAFRSIDVLTEQNDGAAEIVFHEPPGLIGPARYLLPKGGSTSLTEEERQAFFAALDKPPPVMSVEHLVEGAFGSLRAPDPTLMAIATGKEPPHFVGLSAVTIDPLPRAHRIEFKEPGIRGNACSAPLSAELRADLAAYICEPCSACFPEASVDQPWQTREGFCHICTNHQSVYGCSDDLCGLIEKHRLEGGRS